MDELLHHCIRELAFEGDLGCDVSRLRDFITDFYEHTGSPQNVDDAYCGFVWSVIAQQPEVRVGLAPPGAQEVYIAPQAIKNAGVKSGVGAADSLSVIPDAENRPLYELRARYGDSLRIAVDPERSFVAITGSHIRPSKLTPTVYTCLQLVSRGRERGISAVDLSKKTGYDAKTVHYLVEKLVSLNLVVKRKKAGVGANFCIHKYFFERSQAWQDVVAEEEEAMQQNNHDGDDEEFSSSLHFDPIDSRHLSSLQLVQARIEKLLRISPHQTHSLKNLIIKIGFAHPSKMDRNFFLTRVRELETNGVLERVEVPREKGKPVTCIRLLSPPKPEEQSSMMQNDSLSEGLEVELSAPKATVAFHRQLIDIMHDTGTEGATLGDISKALGDFDRRIIDHQLNRLKEIHLPSHLRDLEIAQISETFGRERRYKYFSAIHYQKVAERENIDSPYAKDYFDHAGGFGTAESGMFFSTSEEFNKFVDNFKAAKDEAAGKKVEKKPLGRPRKRKRDDDLDGGEASAPPKKKRAGKKAVTAPPPLTTGSIAENGEPSVSAPAPVPKRRGRPPKNKPPVDPDAPPPPPKQKRQPKAKAEPTEPKVPKKRGRPPKIRPPPEDTPAVEAAPVDVDVPADPIASEDEVNVSHLLPPSATRINGALHGEHPPEALPVVDRPLYPEHPEESVTFPHPSSAAITSAEHTVVDHAASTEPSSPRPQEKANTVIIPSSLIDPALLELDGIAAPPRSPPPPPPSDAGHPTSLVNEPVSLDGLISFDDDESHTSKRPPSPGPSSLPPAKRVKTETTSSARGRTNISKVRRRKELLQVITNLGGIANLSSKEFHEAHTALIDSLIQAGEATSSSVGSKIDKRTVYATLNELESQGLVRVKATVLTSPTGSNKQIKIACLAETPEEDVEAFLKELSLAHSAPQASAVKLLEEPIEYGGSKPQRAPRQHVSAAQADEEDPEEAPQPVQSEDDIIRSVMLAETNTIIQQYGFIVGKIARAKALHLHILEVFDQHVSPDIVSEEPRILHIPYIFQNIPVGIYRSVVSIRTHSDELLQLLSTPEGRSTPVGSLPQDIINLCEMNRSRSRTKMLELLETLQSLGLLVPLHGAVSSDPLVQCRANGDHPTAFEEAPLDPIATASAPQYWLINPTAPVHMWALADVDPPFHDTFPVHSVADGERFWQELNRVSLEAKYGRSILASRAASDSSEHVEADVGPLTVKLLRRETQWSTSYNFCYKQKAYLRRFTTDSDASTPLQDPDQGPARLAHIAHIVCAPVAEVAQFYEHERGKMVRDMEKLERKRMFVRTSEEDKATLAQKAAEAKAQRKKDWEDMVARVHPEPLKSHEQSRVRTIRHRFLQSSGTDMQKWEREIQDAILEAAIPAKPSTSLLPGRLGTQVLPSLPVNTNEKSIEELIANQIPRPPAPAKLSKKEREKAKQEAPSTSAIIRRRTRFNWTKDYEELARDASAIIRARCRDGKRLDWSAIEVLFPGVPRNTVRQRIGHLREAPGADIYFKRLEDRWYELWQRHLNTPELPDEDPGSATNFDIVAHIKFLRSHVDKNALRVGFAEATEQPLTATLPGSVDAIAELWDVVEKPRATPSFDYLWSIVAEEGREKQFARDPFVLGGNELPADLKQYDYEKLYTADTALKMALATSIDVYDADGASRLLKSVGDEAVQSAVHIMSDRSVISMTVRDPRKTKPGRTFKISDFNQGLLVGPFPSETYQEAELFEDALVQNDDKEWGEWPLLSSDGDAVALLELVSENKVEMKVDLTHFQAVRAAVDWNSKKADDDHIETAVFVRMKEAANVPAAAAADVTMHDDDADASTGAQTGPHGTNADGKTAACALSTSGPVDCAVCLESVLIDLRASLEPDDAIVLDGLVQQLDDAGPPGLTRKQLETICSRDLSKLSALIDRLVGASPSIAFWTGYNEVVLVSSQYVDEWTVVLSQDDTSCARTFPRRWLDIHGRRIGDVWDAACRAVVGTVLLHPAISQGELRWRLRTVYNRQEVEDVLRHLAREGYLKRIVKSEGWWCEGPPGNVEEGAVLWVMDRNRAWYHL